MKGLFVNKSTLFQFGVLFYFFLMGALLSMLVGYTIGNLTGSDQEAPSDRHFFILQASQFFSATLMFIIPAICTAYFCSMEPSKFLHIKKINVRIILLSAVMLILISPAIDITTYLNSKIHFPDFMAPVEAWMIKADAIAAEVTVRLLSEKGLLPLLINILVICVMAGLAEELIFRGALLSVIRKKIKNPHVAIWIVAIIFSVIHFQFSGFIPRILLGAFLGYLLYWTNSIWAPIFAHFLNNTIAIAGYKLGLYQLSSDSSALISADTSTEHLYTTIILAIAGLALFALCAKKMKAIGLQSEENT